MLRSTAALAALALVALASPARAEDVAAAKLHYERGTTLFDLQRYAEAAKEYEAAFEAKNDPALLFNIGQAYRFAGDYNKAIVAFKSFLRRLPNTENRSEVESRIVELQKLAEEQRRSQQSPPAGTLKPEVSGGTSATAPTPAETKPAPPMSPAPETANPGRTKLIAGLCVAAAGVAAIAVGGAFEGLAKSQNDALSSPPRGMVFDPSKEQTLKTDQTLGAVFLAVGGAALVAGGVVAILGARERKATQKVAVLPAASSTSIGMVVHAAF